MADMFNKPLTEEDIKNRMITPTLKKVECDKSHIRME